MNSKNVLITGAASGIGLATARFLHKQGYIVGMADLSLSSLKDATHDFDANTIRLYELDVTDFQQSQQVLSEFCAESNSSLSVLINNAGILEIGQFENINNEKHARTLNVNVMGVINLCQAAFPYLKRNRQATVININSASSDYGVPELSSYSASKFAVKSLTESLEIEWQKYGIKVCDVLPPFIATHMVNSQQVSAKVIDRMGVNLTAEDVVKVIFRQVENPKTHRTVGLLYGLLHRLANISPSFVNRFVMKFLSR